VTVSTLDIAHGDLTAQGTAFGTAEIYDKAGKLVAMGQGSFRIIR
jgi:acyl-coenzyme A thioesterase PaaI-like protein